MNTATPHQKSLVTKRNNLSQQVGLVKSRYARLDTAIMDAVEDDLERSLLPDDVIQEARDKGCKTAGELALWRLRDSLDPTHNAKFWNLVTSRMPKTIIHVDVDRELTEIPTSEILAHLEAIEAEVVDSAENDTMGESQQVCG
tara:strand:+ start:362 stop:790 length:429 start_codon:yes stop_codon:yes gene_type:complete